MWLSYLETVSVRKAGYERYCLPELAAAAEPCPALPFFPVALDVAAAAVSVEFAAAEKLISFLHVRV